MNKKLLSKISVVGLVVLFVVAAFGSSDGGWKAWDSDPTYGAYVMDVMVYDGEKSVEIADTSDLVHMYPGYTSGKWTYAAYQYIPEEFSGNTYFIMLSDYQDGAGQENQWALQLRFDALNQVVESEHDAISLPLITGQWVELLTLIDLDTDLFKFYYDGTLLTEKAWTAGPNNEGWPAFPDLKCTGEIRAEDVTPGGTAAGQFTVENDGDAGSELDWEIVEYPEWGSDWTFTPDSGTGLTPEAGAVTVDVSFVAPPDSETEFFGEIKVVNSNNAGDFCKIDVYVITPRSRSVHFPLFYRIFERFPNNFLILRNLLGF